MGFSRTGPLWLLCVVVGLAACGSTPTREARSTSTSAVPTRTTAPREVDEVQRLPLLSFANATTGWRIDPVHFDAIERTTDGGRDWTRQLSIQANGGSGSGVHALDDHTAVALVYAGTGDLTATLWGTDDGQHWVPTRGRGLPAPLAGVSFVDRAHAWGVTRFGEIVSTSDAGTAWSTRRQPYPGVAVDAVCLSSPGIGWAATTTSVYESTDDGATWRRSFVLPVGGGAPGLVCNGAHIAYASFDVGAGQHIGAFVRSDDGGARWRPLTEDKAPGGSPLTAPGFPDDQERGDPTAMFADGTLVFTSGCHACGLGDNWVVSESPAHRFHLAHFDSAGSQQIVLLAATAVDPRHLFVETETIFGNRTGPRPVFVYATGDGGHHWRLRWHGQ